MPERPNAEVPQPRPDLGSTIVAFAVAAIFAALAPVALAQQPSAHADGDLAARVARILAETPLIDGHNDLAENYRDRVADHLARIDIANSTAALDPPLSTDIPRLRQGGVGGQFWSVYVSANLKGADPVVAVFEQIDLVHRMIDRYPETFELATTAADVERIHRAGRIASMIGMEGGHSIDNSIGVLRQAYACGARYMTLTHWNTIDWADAATDKPLHGGLTAFGREVVREMNRLGMLVDLSHVSDATMLAAIQTSEAPVIFSHSSARALCDHVRNVPDEILRKVAVNGGVVMVNFAPGFVSEEVRLAEAPLEAEWTRLGKLYPNDSKRIETEIKAFQQAHPAPKATLAHVANHLDHIRAVAGADHVGIGSDFDGISSTPVGLEDVSKYPALLEELLRRGWSDADVAKAAGGNVLRVMREVERVAARLQKTRPPSDARIEELDAPPAAGDHRGPTGSSK